MGANLGERGEVRNSIGDVWFMIGDWRKGVFWKCLRGFPKYLGSSPGSFGITSNHRLAQPLVNRLLATVTRVFLQPGTERARDGVCWSCLRSDSEINNGGPLQIA